MSDEEAMELATKFLRERPTKNSEGWMGGCTSYVQRKLQIGYNRGARLLEMLEERGVITPCNDVGERRLLP